MTEVIRYRACDCGEFHADSLIALFEHWKHCSTHQAMINLEVEEQFETWERELSEGKTWKELS